MFGSKKFPQYRRLMKNQLGSIMQLATSTLDLPRRYIGSGSLLLAPRPSSNETNLLDEQKQRKDSGASVSISSRSLAMVPVFGLEYGITEMGPFPTYKKLEPVVHTIRHRKTTKMSDETVYMATLMT